MGNRDVYGGTLSVENFDELNFAEGSILKDMFSLWILRSFLSWLLNVREVDSGGQVCIHFT